jgi:soluble lytic murein transglycosylase-like protein
MLGFLAGRWRRVRAKMNTRFDPLIQDASVRYGVPFAWIKAVIATESNFNPLAKREEPAIGDRSLGLMQILTRTARGLGFDGPDSRLFDPAVNIDLGARLLADLRRRYISFERTYSAYNSGRPDLYLESSTVRRNVDRALGWLSQIDAPSSGLAVVVGLGLLSWWFRAK